MGQAPASRPRRPALRPSFVRWTGREACPTGGKPAGGALAHTTSYTQNVSPARALAFEILMAEERGGYASDLLTARAAPLDSRDAGLASEIGSGVLRYRPQLDYLIEHYSGKPAARLTNPCGRRCAWGSSAPLSGARAGACGSLGKRRTRQAGAQTVAPGSPMPCYAKLSRASGLAEPGCGAFASGLAAGTLAAPIWRTRRGHPRANLRTPETYVNMATGRTQDIGSQSIVPLLRWRPA